MTGPELKHIRLHLHLTQVALARELECSRESVRRYEQRAQVPPLVARAMNSLLTTRRTEP